MISPHHTTMQTVAEAARRERLARLAAAHQYPGPINLIWERFKAGPVIRWFALQAGRNRAPDFPVARPNPVVNVPAPKLASEHLQGHTAYRKEHNR